MWKPVDSFTGKSDLKEGLTVPVDSLRLPRQESVEWRNRSIASKYKAVLWAILTIVAQTGQNVTLPLFADAIGGGGGTPYFVVWFSTFAFAVGFGIMLVFMWIFTEGEIGAAERATLSVRGQTGLLQIGLADALNGMLVVFASPSSRTAPYLQAILGNFLIPLTIIMRMVLVRKLPSKKQALAALLVLVGLFVSLIPTIANWTAPGPEQQQQGVMWPALFMLGFVPAACMVVAEEKALHGPLTGVNVVWVVFWVNVWDLVFITAFMWVDLIPGYGMSDGK
jgi:hypothetical protein